MVTNLPAVSRKEFLARLKKHPHENVKLIDQLEEIIIRQRGFVFKMPPPKTPVVLLASGGIDSIATWLFLLQVYQLKVFPLFLIRKSKFQKEPRTVKYFNKYFHKKYPRLSQPLQIFSTKLSPPQIYRSIHQPHLLHPESILKSIKTQKSPYINNPLPSIEPYYASLYLKYLQTTKNLSINTIFTGITPNDSHDVKIQSLTSLRINLLNLVHTQNKKIQLSSLLFEKETNHWLNKKDVIPLCHRLKLPLEKTWSCYRSQTYHCGRCRSCLNRIKHFKLAKIKDLTQYQSL